MKILVFWQYHVRDIRFHMISIPDPVHGRLHVLIKDFQKFRPSVQPYTADGLKTFQHVHARVPEQLQIPYIFMDPVMDL